MENCHWNKRKNIFRVNLGHWYWILFHFMGYITDTKSAFCSSWKFDSLVPLCCGTFIPSTKFYISYFVLYLLKILKNLQFSDVFRGYWKRPESWNWLIYRMKYASFGFILLCRWWFCMKFRQEHCKSFGNSRVRKKQNYGLKWSGLT